MLQTLSRRGALGPIKAPRMLYKPVAGSRHLATVQEGNTPRTVPNPRTRATPVSHDRATFTIRVGRAIRVNADTC